MPKFSSAQVIVHGVGAIAELNEQVARRGAKPAIVTDAGLVKAGIVDRIREVVDGELLVFDQVQPEPPYQLADRCAEWLKENRCDLVIGLGGGSSIDTAKMSAVLVGNGGSVTDYWGADRVPSAGLPIIAVPTTAGTGSEVSPAAVFVDRDDHTKKGVRSDFMLADVAILDPALTVGLPPALTASTGMDALTHAVEAYVSPNATVLSDANAESAISLIGQHLPVAYANGSSLAAREGQLMGSLFAGFSFAAVNTAAVHALAQALGGRVGMPHGTANSLFLHYVMAYNRMACTTKYARVAELLGEPVAGLSTDEAAKRAVAVVRRLSLDLGIPQRLRDVGVPEEALEPTAKACVETQGRLLLNNPRRVSEQDALEILQEAF